MLHVLITIQTEELYCYLLTSYQHPSLQYPLPWFLVLVEEWEGDWLLFEWVLGKEIHFHQTLKKLDYMNM